MLSKHARLHIARRMVVKIIESDFTISNHPRMFREFSEALKVPVRQVLRLMRVGAHRGINPVVLLGKRNGRIEFFRTRP